MPSNPEYLPVEQRELDSNDLQYSKLLDEENPEPKSSRLYLLERLKYPILCITAVNFCILVLSTTLFISSYRSRSDALLGLQYAREENRHFADHCNERTGTYSPAWEAIQYKTVEFAGTFDLQNVYKGTPRPELDEAWDALIHGGNFAIDEDAMHRINKSHNLEYAVKFPEETGGGYVAGLEMFHQMHCVNFLRQYTYREYYENDIQAFTDGPELLRLHLDHCIDMLRQVVMCYADTTLLTGVWVKGYPRLSADFNTQHKCRDYEALKDWNKKHADRPESYSHIRKPEGAKEMEMPSWVALQEDGY